MLGAEFEYELLFLGPVSDLVLFPIKSGSRSRIWFCLEPNLSLGLGFGIGLGLFSVPDLVPV